MKKIIHLFLVFILLAISMFSCKKDTPKIPINPLVDVYLGGYYTKDALTQAAYWRNNEFHPVTKENYNSWAYGIAVNQGHVYLVGEYDNQPCYWKNGQRFNLDAPVFKGFANAIEVKEDILYISGSTKQSQDDPYNATLWIIETQGGQNSQLPLELIKSNAKDVTVDGDRVYIAGDINDKPCYWTYDIGPNVKNRIDLGEEGWGSATDIIIYNGKVYSLGYYETNEINPYYNCYWENQLIHPHQTSGYYHNNLGFSSTGTLFIVGCDYIPDPMSQVPVIQNALFWEGPGFNVNQLAANSFAEAIAFNGSDIYIAGKGPNSACYWKNGNLVNLNTPVSVVTDIVLVEK